MYHDAGGWVLLVWLVLWMIIIGTGVKSFRTNPGINSVYALSGISTCIFSAIFIRSFQVYPVWIMIAIVLGVSLAWIHRVTPQTSHP